MDDVTQGNKLDYIKELSNESNKLIKDIRTILNIQDVSLINPDNTKILSKSQFDELNYKLDDISTSNNKIDRILAQIPNELPSNIHNKEYIEPNNTTLSSNELSMELVMDLELNIPHNNVPLQECYLDNLNFDIHPPLISDNQSVTNDTKSIDKNGGNINDFTSLIDEEHYKFNLIDNVNQALLNECQNLLNLLYMDRIIYINQTVQNNDLELQFTNISEEYRVLKLKFDKLKQLVIKSRKDEKLLKEKTNSEIETYEMCITQNHEKLAEYMDEIQLLKDNNSKLILLNQQLESKMTTKIEEYDLQLVDMKKNLEIKIDELEMSRQANEFLNDENLNLKLAIKTIQLDKDTQNINEKEKLEEEIETKFKAKYEKFEKEFTNENHRLLSLLEEAETTISINNEQSKIMTSKMDRIKKQLESVILENKCLKEELVTIKLQKVPIDDIPAIENRSIMMMNLSNSQQSLPNFDISLNNIHNHTDDNLNSPLLQSLSISESSTGINQNEIINTLIDSENTTQLLKKQINVLRNEIRRLERNQSRIESIKNIEYLKDTIINFLKMDPNGKKNIVPVLVKILKLDESEKNILLQFSELYINLGSNSQSSWYSYLMPW